MTPIIIYLLKVSICLCLFYWLYQWQFVKLKHFQLNRLFLLSSVGFSFVIPMVHINFAQPNETTDHLLYDIAAPTRQLTLDIERQFVTQPLQVSPIASSTLTIADTLIIIYLCIGFAFLLQYLYSLWGMFRSIKQSTPIAVDGVIIRNNEKIPSSSFFHFLFLRGEFNEQQTNWIIKHEQAHAKQYHSLDLLFLNFTVILLWFNPLLRLYRKELTLLHEYLADQKVVHLGADKKEYAQFLVLQQSDFKKAPHAHYFASNTRRRIERLFQSASDDLSLLRYFSLVPVIGVAMLLFSANVPFDLKGNIQDIVDQAAIVFEKPAELPNENYLRFQWGEEVFDFYFEASQPEEMAGYPHPKSNTTTLEKKVLLRLFHEKVQITNWKNQKVQISNFRISDWNDIIFYPSDFSDGRIIEIIEEADDRSVISMIFELDNETYVLSFSISDPNTADQYIEAADVKLSFGDHYAGENIFYCPANTVTNSEFLSILEDDFIYKVISVDQWQPFQWKNARFYEMRGPSEIISKRALERKLRSSKVIEYPIMVAIPHDEKKHYFAFDDDPIPYIEYQTWSELSNDPIAPNLYPRELQVRERIEIEWGNFTVQYKTEKGVPYSNVVSLKNKRPSYPDWAQSGRTIKGSKEDVIDLLNSSPKWHSSINTKWKYLNCTVYYIDHEGLPTERTLTYDKDGMIYHNQKWVDEVISRLKADDFINFDIFQDGEDMTVPGFTVKIVE